MKSSSEFLFESIGIKPVIVAGDPDGLLDTYVWDLTQFDTETIQQEATQTATRLMSIGKYP